MPNYDSRAIATEDGGRYLEVCYRIEDAKRDGCRIASSLVFLNDTMAVFKAEVFNNAGRKLSEAFGSRSAKFEPFFVEHSETAAIGRALSEAGYNIYSYELTDDLRNHAVTLDDGEEYVNVPYRVAKFRKEHPEAMIKKTILTAPIEKLSLGIATIKVEIIEADVIISTAHAQRRYDDDEKRRQFVECAETAAIGRALSILGYDLPPGEGNQFGDIRDIADAPVMAENAGLEAKENETVPACAESSVQGEPTGSIPEPPKTEEGAKPASSGKAKEVSELPSGFCLDNPEAFVAPSGRYKGKTLGELWRMDWTYIRKIAFSAEVAKFAEPELVANAKGVCMKYGVKSEHDMFTRENRTASGADTGKPHKGGAESSLSSYIIPSGIHRGMALGEIWDTDWKYVRKLAYDPNVAKCAEPELVANAKTYCNMYNIRSLEDNIGKPVDEMSHEELEEQLFGRNESQPDTRQKASPAEVEKAGKFVLTQGMKHPNESIKAIYEKDPSYVSWIAYKSNYGEDVKAAAKTYFEARRR